MGIGKVSRHSSLLALAASIIGGFCASAFGQVADPGNLYYPDLGGNNSQSALCCYGINQNNLAATEVTASQFAGWVGNAFDPLGVPDIQNADFFFQECYGGGMFTPLINALGTVQWAGGSASAWSQTSFATLPSLPQTNTVPPIVQPQYATWSAGLIPQMFNNPNQSVRTDAKIAQQQDFWGPNSPYYREDPNYLSYNGGSANSVADPAINILGGTHYGVIFMGDMGIYNTQGDLNKLGQSMRNVTADLIKTLSADWAGQKFQIYLLFGDGTNATLGYNTASSIGANVGLNMVSTITNPANNYNTTIMSATQANLQNVIQGIGAQANSINNQFLFFGFDHGARQITPQPRIIAAGPNSPPISNGSNSVASGGGQYTTTFSLEDPNAGDPTDNPNGEITDSETEEDPADPPTLTITYDGIDPSLTGEIDVLLNGDELGTLDPTNDTVTLDVTPSDLEDGDTIVIEDNSNEAVNIDSETFDSGALPPEYVPEPAAASLALLSVGFLAKRRRAAKVA
jgi:hypothetical protein